MFHKSTLIVTFAGLLWASAAFAGYASASQVSTAPPQISKWNPVLRFARGAQPRDALLLGMWSHHLTKNPFRYQTTHNLVALQHRSFFLGTFVNSHSDQTVVVGIARTLYSTKILREKIRFELGYKVGPMYGYRNKIPNIKGVSILPLLTGGFTYKVMGVDVNAVPGNALTINFRLEKP